MSSTPSQRRQDTQFSGRALKSADFGSSFGGSPPEQPQIKGLGLPQPTQLIRVPTEVRSTEAVVQTYGSAKPEISHVVEKLARGTSHQARVFVVTLADYSVDAGRFVARQLDRAVQAIASQHLGRQTGDATLGFVKATAKFSVIGTRATMRAMRIAYLQVRAAIDEGFELAMDSDPAGSAPAPNKAPATLAANTALRARATLTSAPVVELEQGSQVTVYPQHDAPVGWILAQGPNGEIGFLPLDDIDALTVVG